MNAPLEKLPPQNPEAERSVLGAMLLDRNAVISATEFLQPEDFYRQAHRVLFETMARLADRLEPVDTVTVVEELDRAGVLEEVGGLSYITALAEAVPTAANAEYYAGIVEQKSLLRKLVAAAAGISREVYEGSEEPDVLLDRAEQLIFNVAQRRRVRPYAALKDVLHDTLDRLEYLFRHKGAITGIPSGFQELDEKTSGFHPSELIILAARPSVGKTTLSLQIARNVAVDAEVPVVFFSLEMAREQLAQRLLGAEARVSGQRLRTGYFNRQDFETITSVAATRLGAAPFYIDDTPNLSVMEVRSRARRLKAERNIGFMVIDYLQLMHTRGQSENRQQEMAQISRSLKALARELEIPILALSQLSRAVEQGEREPRLSDLRDSGAIEQDADVVMFIHEEKKEKANPAEDSPGPSSSARPMNLILAKQRNGPVGSIAILFVKDLGRFERPEYKREAPSDQ